MNTRHFLLACASVVATAVLVTGCNGSDSGDTANNNDGTTASAPAKPTPSAKATDGSKDDPNWSLLQEIDPCMLLTDTDMNKLFKTTGFGHEGGGYVERFYGRHCVFTGNDAYIDNDASSFSREDVKIDVVVQLDDKNGTLWQSMKDAGPKPTVAITGVDEALKVGNGWIQAKRNRVIITVQDNNQVLNDTGAASVIARAFTNLSGHHG